MAWFNLYMTVEAAAGAENTAEAKRRDLNGFLDFFTHAVGSDHPDHWTRSVTTGYLKLLEKQHRKSPTTINRALATLRHAANWLHRQRPFLAGNPCERVNDLNTEAPEWKGLKDIEVTRLKAAGEQLLHLKRRRNQNAVRDYAIFLVLLHTGLRISELLSLELDQYRGKHFLNVKRKGKNVTRRVFLAQEPREALDHYLRECRGKTPGPLFSSRSGHVLARQNVDQAAQGTRPASLCTASQGPAYPPLRSLVAAYHAPQDGGEVRRAVRHGTGRTHFQPLYLAYVQPSDEEKEAALEDLF